MLNVGTTRRHAVVYTKNNAQTRGPFVI